MAEAGRPVKQNDEALANRCKAENEGQVAWHVRPAGAALFVWEGGIFSHVLFRPEPRAAVVQAALKYVGRGCIFGGMAA